MMRRAEGPAPEGLLYVPELVRPDEERELVARLRAQPYEDIRMHGVVAKRRTAHFGWLYGYESWEIAPGPPVPEWLLGLRARSGELIGAAPEQLEEVLLTEYPSGAGIGWHRDAPMFGDAVVGVSLLSPCRMRFQRGKGEARRTSSVVLEPRSAYVLSGPARREWQHSIPGCKDLRYSITFRTLRGSG